MPTHEELSQEIPAGSLQIDFNLAEYFPARVILRLPGSGGWSRFELMSHKRQEVTRYFGFVRMVSFGSRTILCVPAGADK